jgi:hypothetical protein
MNDITFEISGECIRWINYSHNQHRAVYSIDTKHIKSNIPEDLHNLFTKGHYILYYFKNYYEDELSDTTVTISIVCNFNSSINIQKIEKIPMARRLKELEEKYSILEDKHDALLEAIKTFIEFKEEIK